MIKILVLTRVKKLTNAPKRVYIGPNKKKTLSSNKIRGKLESLWDCHDHLGANFLDEILTSRYRIVIVLHGSLDKFSF